MIHRHLLLHKQGQQWQLTAALEFSDCFKSLQSTLALKPVMLSGELSNEYDLRFQTALGIVKQYQSDMLQEYDAHVKRWTKYIKKQTLTLNELMDYYINSLPTDASSFTHGTADFFNLLDVRAQTQKTTEEELIAALARATTLRLIPDLTQKMQHQPLEVTFQYKN